MKLNDLLAGLELLGGNADPEQEITGVSYDSRTTKPGDLFVAVSGMESDGHRYIPMAQEKGAVCAVCEHEIEGGLPHAVVASSRRALAVIGANWYGHPARELTMIGVTGTSGKTTSTYLIKSILEQKAGAKVGLIGTIQNMIGSEVIHTERTTPESFELQGLLRRMADAGCTHAVMEVSSHALQLDRVYGIQYAVGIFTNLSQDHLDFHKTMENYCDAKALLFRQCDIGIYNADDPWHERLLKDTACPRLFSYSVRGEADLMAKNVALHPGSVDFDAEAETEWAHMHVGIPALFTVYNTLDAVAACWNLGVPLGECADALENVLRSVKSFAKGRTVVLFGCGGDRDKTKRPVMGKIAAELADFVIVTSDNPRTEQPQAIIDDILAGMQDSDTPRHVEPDRVEAIHYAMDNARPGDVIILAGKGHEDYQEINHVHYPMDERVIVADYLK